MDQNPYQSPDTYDVESSPARPRRHAGYLLAWVLCFAIPSLAVVIAQRTPETTWGGLPGKADNAVTRLSRMIRVRADLPALMAIAGCLISAWRAPISRPWKTAIMLVTLPLVVMQFVVILFVLVWIGRLSV
jgi:hypothetical protein